MRISTTAILTIFVPYGECKIVARDSIGSLSRLPLSMGSRDGAVVRALASYRCGLGSIPGPSVTCGLSLLLVLVPAPRVFLRVFRFPPATKINASKS